MKLRQGKYDLPNITRFKQMESSYSEASSNYDMEEDSKDEDIEANIYDFLDELNVS